jgi:hypothetical protein
METPLLFLSRIVIAGGCENQARLGAQIASIGEE